MFDFFETFLSPGGRRPVAVAERLFEAAMALFRRRRERNKRIDLALSAFRHSNYMRSDIGLPPVDSSGRPL